MRRPARDASAGRSATPIYDELYAEWRRSFKALPGDRSGEEDLGLPGFDSRQPYASQHGHPGSHTSFTGHPDPTAHSSGHHEHTGHSEGSSGSFSWYATERQRGARPPAALPPAPRRPRWERA
ncbi:hypothetical protein [Streptomyces sp. NPDC002851]